MGVNDYIHVGQKIKKARLSQGLSQKEMAALMELPISTYANYEADRREMSTGLISTAALLLDISLADLMGCQYNGVDPRKMIDERHLEVALNGREKLGYGPYTKFSSSSAPASGLTEQEKWLIDTYRKLDEPQRERLLAYIEGLLDAGSLKNHLYESPVVNEFMNYYDSPSGLMVAEPISEYTSESQYEPVTIAAHHDSDEWSEDELKEIEDIKKYAKSKKR